MSDPSDNSAQLADQLRATALKNLGRSSKQYRSSISGKYVTQSAAPRHPNTTTSETTTNSGTSRSSASGRFLGRKRNG